MYCGHTRMKYRITESTLAIIDDNGSRTMVTVPAGSIVLARDLKLTPTQMLHVEWNGRHVLMFVQDLRMRGEAISCQAA